jgi:quercetin dioxygenase-like cupin family protein
LILALAEHRRGIETSVGNRVVYDVERDAAHFGAASVPRHALVWELSDTARDDALLAAEVVLDRTIAWLMRCDRVDFPPGGVAYRHTHPGPGIRCLLHGTLSVETGGESRRYGPFEPWFESGPEPVFAAASAEEETAFVRVLLLPREWAGKRTIRYVDPVDEAKPKLQRARVFFDEPIEL